MAGTKLVIEYKEMKNKNPYTDTVPTFIFLSLHESYLHQLDVNLWEAVSHMSLFFNSFNTPIIVSGMSPNAQ